MVLVLPLFNVTKSFHKFASCFDVATAAVVHHARPASSYEPYVQKNTESFKS